MKTTEDPKMGCWKKTPSKNIVHQLILYLPRLSSRSPYSLRPTTQNDVEYRYSGSLDHKAICDRPQIFITDIINKNEHAILGLDANKVLEPVGVPAKKTSMTVLQRDYGLQDIYEYQHETLRDTTTKKKTQDRPYANLISTPFSSHTLRLWRNT